MTAIDEMLRRNKTAAMYHPSGLGPSPLKHLAVVMCMDCRVDAHVAFRLNPGEIHLVRNAGGIISDDVIRSLAISQHALGTREIMIVHHSDCGLAKLDEDERVVGSQPDGLDGAPRLRQHRKSLSDTP